jgi:hypothetical protein
VTVETIRIMGYVCVRARVPALAVGGRRSRWWRPSESIAAGGGRMFWRFHDLLPEEWGARAFGRLRIDGAPARRRLCPFQVRGAACRRRPSPSASHAAVLVRRAGRPTGRSASRRWLLEPIASGK